MIQVIIEPQLSSARSSSKNSHKWTMSLCRGSDSLRTVYMEERSKQKLSEWADWVEFELTRKEAFLLGQTCLQGGVGGGVPALELVFGR